MHRSSWRALGGSRAARCQYRGLRSLTTTAASASANAPSMLSVDIPPAAGDILQVPRPRAMPKLSNLGDIVISNVNSRQRNSAKMASSLLKISKDKKAVPSLSSRLAQRRIDQLDKLAAALPLTSPQASPPEVVQQTEGKEPHVSSQATRTPRRQIDWRNQPRVDATSRPEERRQSREGGYENVSRPRPTGNRRPIDANGQRQSDSSRNDRRLSQESSQGQTLSNRPLSDRRVRAPPRDRIPRKLAPHVAYQREMREKEKQELKELANKVEEKAEQPDSEAEVVADEFASKTVDKLMAVDAGSTNLHALFEHDLPVSHTSDAPATTPPASQEDMLVLRIREKAGDYQRYLSSEMKANFGKTVGPLSYAQLVWARRRDVGLRWRRNGFARIQRLVPTIQAKGSVAQK